MDPISFAIELEIGGVLIALVGGVATWLHDRNQKKLRRQQEAQHQEVLALRERHHREHMAAMRQAEQTIEEVVAK